MKHLGLLITDRSRHEKVVRRVQAYYTDHPMEALKTYDEPIAASCQIEMLNNEIGRSGELTDDVLDVLVSLPDYEENIRLTCQTKIYVALDELRITYMQPE